MNSQTERIPPENWPLLNFINNEAAAGVFKKMPLARAKVVVENYRNIAKWLAKRLNRRPVVADLTLENLDAWREHVEAATKNEQHREARVKVFVGLWNAAAKLAGQPIDEWYDKRRQFEKIAPELTEAEGSLWHLCVQKYFPANARMQSEGTKRLYRVAVRAMAVHLGREPVLSDLTDETLIAWQRAMMGKLSVYTIREKIGRILSLWNWAARRRIVEIFPTYTRPPGPELMPTALTEEQLRALFEACRKVQNSYNGIPGELYFQAMFAFAFCTGERKGAILALRWEHIDLDKGQATIPAHLRKGKKKLGHYPLWPEVVALLRAIKTPERKLVFPWPLSEGSFYHHLGRIFKRAGLPDDRKHKLHCLRVSRATHEEAIGGDATRLLRHGDRATTEAHYLDRRLIPQVESKPFVPWDKPAPSPVEAVVDPVFAWIA